jgi:hypothetical protein
MSFAGNRSGHSLAMPSAGSGEPAHPRPLLLLLVLDLPAVAQQTDLAQLSIEDLMNTHVTSVSKKDQSLSRGRRRRFS